MDRRSMLIAAGAALGVVGAVGSGGTAAAAGPGGPVFDVRAYGAVGDGVANDTAAFKAAFTAAAATKRPATVLIPPGTYLVAAGQRLTQGMTVSAYGAYIRRTANCGALLKNFVSKPAEGSTPKEGEEPYRKLSGYTGDGDIAVLGGTWDMAGRTYQTQSDAIGFAHADGILVQDCVIKEVPDAHAVELYSVRRGRIVNCVFEGMYSTSAYRWMKEAVQITSATGEPNLPLDTPEVVTGCVDILVSGCTVRVPEAGANGADPVGPFAALCGDHGAGAVAHRGIRVIGNHIEGVLSDGIRAADWEDSVISGNTIVGAGNYGIRALSFADRQRTGLVITGNTIRNTSGEAAVQLSQYPGAVVGNNSIQGTKQAGTATNCQGIHLLNSPGAVVSENSLGGIDGDGIGIDGSDGAMITGNRIADCTHDGIAAGSNNLTIRQNSVTGVQPVAGGLYGRYGIRVYGTATNVSVQGNTVRRAPADTSPNPAATAVAIRATAAGTWVTGNDLRGFGSTTWDSKSTSTVLGENLVDAPPVL